MSEDKLSSDEVPGKFTEWLLAMGCPAEKVASVENIAKMCRGQYYMVWRSLMEQVEARDVIRRKRLQVFCDDIRRCQKKNVLCESDEKTMPEELFLWRQQAELRNKVEAARARVLLAQKDLDQLTDKVLNKMCQREVSRRHVSASARRAALLRQLGAELLTKSDNLRETRAIAHSLCSLDDDTDIQGKLDKCIASFRRQLTAPPAPAALSVSIASTNSVNSDNDFEEQVWQLVKSRGDALCAGLLARRAALVRALAAPAHSHHSHNKVSPQSVVAHTAALHCSLALEATKNNVHLKHARERLLATVTELNNYLTSEACELLVVRCEKAYVEARVFALKNLLDDLTAGRGAFHVAAGDDSGAATRTVVAVDKAIESKKQELKRVIASLATTDRKIQSARECLATVFAGFGKDAPQLASQYKGVQLDLPPESIAGLQQFYAGRREARKQRVDLSLDLEVSDGSFADAIDNNNPRFIDELRIYLKNFNLDKNRQLVLESGEKIWIFETVQSSIERLYTRWLADDLTCAPLCPASGLATNVGQLVHYTRTHAELEALLTTLDIGAKVEDIVITPYAKEEEEITDRTKKRLRESLVDLQKAKKTFALGQEDLQLWANNNTRKYIMATRTVDGLTYRDYESYYIENCLNL